MKRSLAGNVRELRARKQLTQEELAEKADLSLRAIQDIESGAANATLSVLAALAAALGVAPPLLLIASQLEPRKRGRPVGIVEKHPRVDPTEGGR